MNHCLLEVQVQKTPTVRFTQDNQTPIAEMEVKFDSLRAEDPPSIIKVVGWGKLAEELQSNVAINSKLIIEGRLRMNTVPRQDGTKEKRAEFTLSKFHKLSVLTPDQKEEKIQSSELKEGFGNDSIKKENIQDTTWNSSPLVPDTDEIPF